MKKYKYTINGNAYEVSVNEVSDSQARVEVNGVSYTVGIEGNQVVSAPKVSAPSAAPAAAPAASAPAAGAPAAAPAGGGTAKGTVTSPLPGVILAIKVKVGDVVKEGDTVMILEAMKMENNIDSNLSGKVLSINVDKGASVMEGDALLTIGD